MVNSEIATVTTNNFWSGMFFYSFFLLFFFVIYLTYFPSKSSDGIAAIVVGFAVIGIVAIPVTFPSGILRLRIAKAFKHNGVKKYFFGLAASVFIGAIITSLLGPFLPIGPRFVYQITFVSSISGSIAGCLSYMSCI